jgi:hypothetical protein
MAGKKAKRQAVFVDGHPDRVLEATSAGEAIEELSSEEVLEEELEIASADASPDAPGERQDERLAQPFHSVRADRPGPRGCWAMSRSTGEPCASPAMRGHEFCAAHSGKGVSGNPSHYSPIGQAAHREQLAVRATLRAMYGTNRSVGPRAVLRAHVDRQAERIVARALNGALSSEVPDEKAAKLALELIREADPVVKATVEFSENVTPAEVDAMSYRELLAIARQEGLEVPGGLPGATELSE